MAKMQVNRDLDINILKNRDSLQVRVPGNTSPKHHGEKNHKTSIISHQKSFCVFRVSLAALFLLKNRPVFLDAVSTLITGSRSPGLDLRTPH